MITFDEFWDDVCEFELETYLSYNDLKIGYKYANGCGAKGGVKFPDTMWFVSIIAACIIHDIEWKNAKCYHDLVLANRRFSVNLKKIIDSKSINGVMRWIRRYRIASYTSGVELKGTKAYAIERGFIKPEEDKDEDNISSHPFL